MNINVNSWHFKLVKNTFRDSGKPVPASLCPYMRAVLYRVIFFGALIAGATFMLSNMLLPAAAHFGITGFWAYIVSFFGSIITLGGILAFACGIMFAAVWVIQLIQNKWADRKDRKRREKWEQAVEDAKNGIEPKQPNIVWAFVQAKHDKFCPSLNFTNPKDKE